MIEFGALISGLGTSLEIAKTFSTLKGENERAIAVAELTRSIADAQAQLLATMNECFKLTAENQELKKQLEKNHKFERYALCPTSTNSIVLALKDEFVTAEEPMHYICVNCRDDGVFSPLSHTREMEYYCTKTGCEFGKNHINKKRGGMFISSH